MTALIQDNNGTGSTPRAPIIEPDEAILHCGAVSQVCFKWGRITPPPTVPPTVVLTSDGFTKPYGDGGNANSAGVCEWEGGG